MNNTTTAVQTMARIAVKEIEDLERADYRVQGLSGSYYMQSELKAAFELVQDPNDWKNPIVNARIPGAMQQIVADAVSHFAGCLAKFSEPVGYARNAKGIPSCYYVNAKGYYAAVGA